jgi:hypothetical protein
MRSKKLTRTPKASRKAIRHRLRGTLGLAEIGCSKSAPEDDSLDTTLYILVHET